MRARRPTLPPRLPNTREWHILHSNKKGWLIPAAKIALVNLWRHDAWWPASPWWAVDERQFAVFGPKWTELPGGSAIRSCDFVSAGEAIPRISRSWETSGLAGSERPPARHIARRHGAAAHRLSHLCQSRPPVDAAYLGLHDGIEPGRHQHTPKERSVSCTSVATSSARQPLYAPSVLTSL
jgi:hypothetical protein